MAEARVETLPVEAERDVVVVRQAVREWATGLRFGLVDVTKLTTAASELARNALVHGKGGTARLEQLAEGGREGLRVTFEDRGPGIADVDRAMADGFSTGAGLGLGLGGSRRLVHEFAIESRPGEGTRVTITHWRRP